MDLSANAQAILLLTAPLIMGRAADKSVRPLTLAEYNRLARWLKEYGKQPADLLSHDSIEYFTEFQIGVDLERLRQLLGRGFLLSQVLESWRSRSIWTVTRADANYPDRLKRRLAEKSPPVLYGCGDRNLLENGGLAVVGSRNADDVEIEYSEIVGRMAAAAGCSIVSGGARGVDRAAMFGAMEEGGTAVGVLSDGLESAVMNRENRDILIDGRLVLLSPYDPRAGFNVGNAMARNKLVYALADAGLVVESDYGTGGTWNGAVEQLEKMGLVHIYARANGDVSDGLKALHRKGALKWPSPSTPEEFKSVIKGVSSKSLTSSPQQGRFFEEAGDASLIADMEATVEFSRSLSSPPPGDVLFQKVVELLGDMDFPLSDSDVATYLNVSKYQAKDWLKRLEQTGKYRKLNRPVRYVRATESSGDTSDQ